MARIIVNTSKDQFGVVTTFGWEGCGMVETRNASVRTIASDSFAIGDVDSNLILNGEHRRLQQVAWLRLHDLIEEANADDFVE